MKKTPEQYVVDIQEACEQLGWVIALKDLDKIKGLIIGQPTHVDDVLEELDDGEAYEIWAASTSEDTQLH